VDFYDDTELLGRLTIGLKPAGLWLLAKQHDGTLVVTRRPDEAPANTSTQKKDIYAVITPRPIYCGIYHPGWGPGLYPEGCLIDRYKGPLPAKIPLSGHDPYGWPDQSVLVSDCTRTRDAGYANLDYQMGNPYFDPHNPALHHPDCPGEQVLLPDDWEDQVHAQIDPIIDRWVTASDLPLLLL
jgi:hypothetical protein